MRKSYSENIAVKTARGTKKVIKMKEPRLRYRPQRRKFPAPNDCEVSDSCAVFRPMRIASIMMAVKEVARPTTATLTVSFMRPAKTIIVKLHRKASKFVTIYGKANLTKMTNSLPVAGAGMIDGSKKD